jgi:hypothetical protein
MQNIATPWKPLDPKHGYTVEDGEAAVFVFAPVFPTQVPDYES